MTKHLKIFMIFIILTAGCNTIPSNPLAPQLSIANVSLVDANLFEQRFKMKLRIQNPNDFNLPIEAMNYELLINDKPFATGLSNQAITIPKYGSELIEVDAISNISGLLQQFKNLQQNNVSSVAYTLRGTAYLGTHNLRIPFERNGQIALPTISTK